MVAKPIYGRFKVRLLPLTLHNKIITMIELIIALTVWYIIFAVSTNEFNPLRWGKVYQALAVSVSIALTLSLIG